MRALLYEVRLRKQRLLQTITEPWLQQGCTRVRYRCSCGSEVFDDYPLSLHAEAEARQTELRNTAHTPSGNVSGAPSWTFQSSLVNLAITIAYAAAKLRDRAQGRANKSETDTESQRKQPDSSAEDDGACFLTCFPRFNDRRATLVQIPEKKLKGDLCYFNHLRTHSKRLQRCWNSLLVPRKITDIRYVHFQLLHDDKRVDVVEDLSRRFPTDPHEYAPIDRQLRSVQSLYVGPRTLLHYYEKPHESCPGLEILQRIPKRLKGQLKRDQQSSSGPVPGWGMQLVDGIDYKRLGLSGFVGLLVCLATSVVWTSTQADVQGGMAIAQCMMMVVTYVVTLSGISEDR